MPEIDRFQPPVNDAAISAGFLPHDRYIRADCEKNPAAMRIAKRFEWLVRCRLPQARLHYSAAARALMQARVHFWFEEMGKEVTVQAVSKEPYENLEAMQRDVRDNKVMKVRYRSGSSTPLVGHCLMQFRAAHDYYGHVKADAPFTFSGELRAYGRHLNLRMFPTVALPFVYNNVVAENTYRLVNGHFLCVGYQCSSPFVFDFEEFECPDVGEWERRWLERE